MNDIIDSKQNRGRSLLIFRVLVSILFYLFIFQNLWAQKVEIQGRAKINVMDTSNHSNLLVVKEADGTLAIREVSSLLQSPSDTTRTFTTDFELAKFLCNCNGNLPPFLVESSLANGYSVKDLFGASVPVYNLVAGGAPIEDLINAGVQVSDLLAADVSVEEIYLAGGSVSDLLAAGITVAELLVIGIPVNEIYSGGGLVIDLLNEGVTPIEIFNAGAPLDSLYGKLYQHEGGYIIYLNTSTGEGMVAGPGDFTAGVWGCEGLTIQGADGIAIGTGLQNTVDIDNGCNQTNNAAERCLSYTYNGKEDWFLPSKDELNLMWTNLILKGIIVMSPNNYWTSSENTGTLAWGQNMANGNVFSTNKGTSLLIRPVRIF